jgi:uncharacterized membrane protein YcjF (UPF0283 family)
MKYCYECGHVTGGEPLFCHFCGRTYNVKLCPRLHANPRFAEVCSQCGSHDLSTPQPKVSFLWRIGALVVRILLGALLVSASLALIVSLLSMREVQNGMIAIGLLLIVLWILWSMLPEWFRKTIHWVLKRKEHRDEQ